MSRKVKPIGKQTPGEIRPEDFAIPVVLPSSKSTPKIRKSRRKVGEFLRGPIPWPWIQAAFESRGSSLFVALAIRHFSDLMGKRTIRISQVDLGGGIVCRNAVSHALSFLESRGLIQVDREPGRLLAITVKELPESKKVFHI
jgi:hypothetical protein